MSVNVSVSVKVKVVLITILFKAFIIEDVDADYRFLYRILKKAFY